MDDPWGSPWADQHNNTGVQLKVDVQPVAPVKVLLQDNKETPSLPWGESDDGFGEWASMPADVVEPTRGIQIGPSSYTWDVADKETGQADELNGHSLSWKYPTGADERYQSSRLSPQEPVQAIREPSPDPWATKYADTAHVEDAEEPVSLDHGVDSDDTVVIEPSEIVATESISSSQSEVESDETAIVDQQDEQIIGPTERPDMYGELTEQGKDIEGTYQGQDIDLESSRPSTSPSE